jgi:lipopolysaccharide transport system ATP-binding protein
MSDEILIRAENVGKKFCRNLKKSLMYGVQDVGFDLLGKDRSHAGLRKDEFWANEGITFELKRGECIGLIGKNGAGKTTLLKMLNGLIKPDAGNITVRGKIGAMIALGAGFNPILSGRENIYINGAVLGLSKQEIDKKLDEIIDFSGIESFIDSPVANYSSGMNVRLGFSIASNMDVDVLLLDEILAVGDANFKSKCYEKISKLKDQAAVVFVSHALEQMSQFCTKGILLESGMVKFEGDIDHAIVHYQSSATGEKESFLKQSNYITNAVFQIDSQELSHNEPLTITVYFESQHEILNCFYTVKIVGESGQVVAEVNSKNDEIPVHLKRGKNSMVIKTAPICLKYGKYYIGFRVFKDGDISPLLWSHCQHSFVMEGKIYGEGVYAIPSTLKGLER